MKSTSALGVLLAGVVVIVALGIWVAVSGGPDGPGTGPQPETPEDGVTTEPQTVPIPPAHAAMVMSDRPWPFEQFADDIAAVRRPAREETFEMRWQKEHAHNIPLMEVYFSLAVENALLEDVVAQLAAKFTHTDTLIWTQKPLPPDSVRFTFDLRDVPIMEVVTELRRQSDNRLDHEVLPKGMVIGMRNAVVQARLDANDWEARQRARKPEPDDPLNDVTYRPEHEGAHIGAVVKDIHAKTEVQVIVGLRVWGKPQLINWKSDPLPLTDALDALAEQLRANWYAKDGRVYLLSR